MIKIKIFIISGLLLILGCGVYFLTFPHRYRMQITEHQTSIEDKKLILGEIRIKTNCFMNQETLVRYMIPLDAQGKPGPLADNIIFYAPYNGNAQQLREELSPWLKVFAEEYGFSVFSIVIETTAAVSNDREKYYIFREAGWYEIIFQIQEFLEEQYKLCHNSLFIVGESSGGSMGQMMAAAYPEKIDGVAWCGGATYEPLAIQKKGAFLALNTWGCYGIPATCQFRKQAEKMNAFILQNVVPPDQANIGGAFFHHAASAETYHIIQTFIRDMIHLRQKNDGRIPEYLYGQSPQNRVDLLSTEFTSLWKQLPESIFLQVYMNSPIIGAEFPITHPPQKVVLLAGDYFINDFMNRFDILYHYSKNKTLPVSIQLPPQKSSLKELDEYLQILLNDEALRNLPVYILANGEIGQLLASAALRNNNPRIKQIILINTAYDHPVDEFSIEANRGKSTIPLKIYFEDSLSQPETEMPYSKFVLIERSNGENGKIYKFFDDCLD